jgi:hypothetical protein
MKSAKEKSTVYQLKITLMDIDPPIWRRVVVPGEIRLSGLHNVIQEAMGWTNSHLHDFLIEKKRYSKPDLEFDSGKVLSESTHRLSQVAERKGMRFFYEYDPGDGWGHEIVVEDIAPAMKKDFRPTCLDGDRACPPEDCGGPGGYEELVESMKGPDNERRREFIDWLGEDFDPESFSLAETNKGLRRIKIT